MAVTQFTVKAKSSFKGNCAEIYPVVISYHLQAELSCYLCLMHYKDIFYQSTVDFYSSLSVVIFFFKHCNDCFIFKVPC